MNLTDLTMAVLKPLERLLKKKEKLLSTVHKLDRQIESLVGGGSGGKGRRARGGRGALKAKIIETLQAAGKQGLHVKELAQKAGVPVPNIRVWFYSTGKKLKEIQQTARATYAWQAPGAGTKPVGKRRKAKAKGKAKAKRRTKSRRPKTAGRKTKARAESLATMPTEAL